MTNQNLIYRWNKAGSGGTPDEIVMIYVRRVIYKSIREYIESNREHLKECRNIRLSAGNDEKEALNRIGRAVLPPAPPKYSIARLINKDLLRGLIEKAEKERASWDGQIIDLNKIIRRTRYK